jgi:hypothetical protein
MQGLMNHEENSNPFHHQSRINMVKSFFRSATKLIHTHRDILRIALLASVVVITLALSSCQSGDSSTSPTQSQISQETSGGKEQSTSPSEGQPTPSLPLDDPDVIQKMWEGSPHADTFIVSATGENNSCSSCHSRYNYIPAVDDIPEECYACKFEVGDPEPFIDEKYWKHVDCMNCHRVSKKEVEPEVAWLEFALIEEYTEVVSVTELCSKCHLAADVTEHVSVVVGGDHPNYQCTECHDAHDTTASCLAAGCHEGTLAQDPAILGHDEDHASVACVACHDADGLEIGFVEDLGVWTTLIAAGTDGTKNRPYTSHNIVLEALCERCHFPGNPWGFSDTVEAQ